MGKRTEFNFRTVPRPSVSVKEARVWEMDRPRLFGVTAAKETRDGDGREDMAEEREGEAPVTRAGGRQ